jgi:citrate lyase subunit beta/citryl-CoA lyase
MPPQSVFPQLDDLDTLRSDCLHWRDRGFFGRSAIHPRQIQTINECYTATAEETSWADQVLALYKESSESGRGALLMDGRLVDLATVRVAEKIRNMVSGQAQRANRRHRKDEV